MADSNTTLFGLIKGHFDNLRSDIVGTGSQDGYLDKMVDYFDDLKITFLQLVSPPYITGDGGTLPVIDFDLPEPVIESPPWLNPPERPDIPELDMPTVTFNFTEIPYVSDLNDDLVVRLTDIIVNGGTGLDADVEEAIWDRAIARTELEIARVRDQMENAIAAKGWTLPSGALQSVIAETIIEETRATADINEKIAIEQARLAQTNTHKGIEYAIALEGQAREYSNGVMNRALEAAKGLITAAVENLKAQVMYVQSLIDIYKGDVLAYEAQVKAAAVEMEAQVEVYKAKVTNLKNETELLIKAGEVNLMTFLKDKEFFMELSKTGANVYAQLVASAMSAMHASASMGYSGSTSYQHDATKTTASGETTSTQHIHTYEEG